VRCKSLVIAALLFVAFSSGQSFADIRLEKRPFDTIAVTISGTITKADADYMAQHQVELNHSGLNMYLKDSLGGDVASAIKIGRMRSRPFSHLTLGVFCVADPTMSRAVVGGGHCCSISGSIARMLCRIAVFC
jgi:hypothetical protein